MFRVTRVQGTLVQTIASCKGHINRTMAELGSPAVTITEVPWDQIMNHTCMGCLKGWPKSDD